MFRRSFPVVLLCATAACACERPVARDEAITHAASISTTPQPQTTTHEPALRSATGFVGDIDALARSNDDFRRVLYTARNSQLVLMSVPAGEHIGEETHDVDQFLRVEGGTGELLLNDARFALHDGSSVVVPAGTRHDVISKGTTALKLYTIYSPPHHRDGVVHRTRADAEHDGEHFDGKTTP